MSQVSATHSGQVSKALLELLENKAEFQLNVDRVRIPHASSVVSFDSTQVVLKMHRPIASELPSGTQCTIAIGVLGEHWKVQLKYLSRVGHLQYSFELPPTMEKVGRREHKRYPFRPRENITVYVQNSSLPGIGAVGTLLDLSLGGLAFRPERAFRIEDGARLKLDTALFETGRIFPVIRIDGLPKLPEPLKLRGVVAHAMEKPTGLFIAFVFGLLDDEQLALIAKVVEAREKMGGGGSVGGGSRPSLPSQETDSQSDTDSVAEADQGISVISPESDASVSVENIEGQKPHLLPAPLLRLARRTTSILLVKPGGEECEKVIQTLKRTGYIRVEQADSLDSHTAQTRVNTDLLLVDIEAGGSLEEPLQAFHNLNERLKTKIKHKLLVITERYDPVILHASEDLKIPVGFTSDTLWIEVIDNEIGR